MPATKSADRPRGADDAPPAAGHTAGPAREGGAAGGGLVVRDLVLSYPGPAGERRHTVLDIAELALPPGARVAITGPSGAGKTSLLYVLTGIERPDRGGVRWGDVELTALREAERDRWRRRNVGLIFQDFELFPGLSPLGNVLLPATFERAAPTGEQRRRARALLERVGVPPDRRDVQTLSRGERQRVAVARALLMGPRIIAADEPTASLDAEAGRAVIDLLLEVCRETGATLLAVTHDQAPMAQLDRVLRLRAGGLIGEPPAEAA